MSGWLGRLVGGSGRQPRLPRLFAEYPPYCQPHPGPGRVLSLPQAEANLAYLLENKAARLEIVAGLLARFDLDLSQGLAARDPAPFLRSLGDWTAAEWPSVKDAALLSLDAWLNSRREGQEIVFSLIMDVAIALGEIVLRRRDDHRWGLDLDPASGADGMVSWRRPVVLRPTDGVVPEIRFDFEHAVYTAYVQCGKPGYNVLRNFGRGALDAISGAHETVWREQAAQRG